eukprot:359616-Chlamydomonas_euryale.AAC.9
MDQADAWIKSTASLHGPPPRHTPHPTSPHPTQIMDTPRPEQVRQLQPDATECTDADALELMEMILGALGRDAVGLGARYGRPKQPMHLRVRALSLVPAKAQNARTHPGLHSTLAGKCG